jgi:hypothetical protein
VVSVVDKITAPLKGITAAVSRVGGSIKGLSDRSGLSVLTNAFSKVGTSVAGLGRAVAGVGKSMLGIAASLGLSGGAAYAAAQAYADATGAIGDLAERTGASRERIQELGYAAQLSGSSAETLGGAIQKMNLVIGQAKSGSKELKEMFAGLQISFKNANGEAKSTDEIFDTVVNRISRIKDPALQAKAAVTIFGKSATELLPLLKGGTKGIAEMAAEARRLGVVIDENGVRAGEEFGDVLDKLKYAFKGVGNTIGSALVPQLSMLATQLTDTIVKYRPQIQAFAEEFAKNLPRYLEEAGAALKELWEALKPIGSAIKSLSDSMGTIKLALSVFVGYVTAAVLPALISVTTALWGLAAAFVATPIGLFIASAVALAGVAVLIYKNWDNFASFFTEKFDAVKSAFKTGLVDGLIEVWQQFNPVGFILDSLNSLVKFITGIDLGSMIKSKVSDLLPGSGGDSDPSAVNQPIGPDQNYTAVPEGGPIAAGLASAKAAITVDFKNLPTGASVDTQATSGANIKTNQGYSMMPIQ